MSTRANGSSRPGHQRLGVTVELVQPTGSRAYITFPLGGVPTVAELEAHDVQRPGEQIDLDLDMNRAVLIDPETNRVHLRADEGGRHGAKQPKRAIKLFGTEVPEPKVRTLQAGALSAVLDNGALRYIKLGDTEVLRAIAFLVRDENWGTFTPEISNLKVKQGKSGFRVSYDARCSGCQARR